MSCCTDNPELRIAVTERGFEPSDARVARGQPITLVVTRETERTCARELVVPALGIREPLPLGEPVRITITPTVGGALRFGCGMGMMIGGTLMVE